METTTIIVVAAMFILLIIAVVRQMQLSERITLLEQTVQQMLAASDIKPPKPSLSHPGPKPLQQYKGYVIRLFKDDDVWVAKILANDMNTDIHTIKSASNVSALTDAEEFIDNELSNDSPSQNK